MAVSRVLTPNFQKFQAFLATNPAYRKGFHQLNHYQAIQGKLPALRSLPATAPTILETLECWSRCVKYTPEHQRVIISDGVRSSLKSLFALEENPVHLPGDLYPVYQVLAKQEECEYVEYPTHQQSLVLPEEEKVTMLVTDPTPFGSHLSGEEVGNLVRWLQESDHRKLIIDAVYSHLVRHDLNRLLATEKVFYCHSLSKTHAIPWHFGLVLGPKDLKNDVQKVMKLPVRENLTKAIQMMTAFPELGRDQLGWYQMAWKQIVPKLIKFGEVDSTTGYLTTIETTHEELLERGILAVPGEVYGFKASVISVLGHLSEKCQTTSAMYHVTRLENFARAFDKYTGTYQKKKITESTFPDQFHLLFGDELEIGLVKHKDNMPIILETLVREPTFPSESGVAQYIKKDHILINRVGIFQENEITWMTVEELFSRSLRHRRADFPKFTELIPRTVSLLPVAQGCQAKCPFCFSHASVSDDVKQKKLTKKRIREVLISAKKAGATRAVITGGGEPMMVPPERLLGMVRQCAELFPKVVMITNGYAIGKLPEDSRLAYLRKLEDSGLSVLSISRHSATENEAIMKLDTKSEEIAATVRKHTFEHLTLRWVCVLQKGGVDSEEKIAEYLDWVAGTGVQEICFKELYISTSVESLYHDYESNRWSRENQVPLVMLTTFLEAVGGEIISRLPWGAPVYQLKWKDSSLKIAAYTEPSVTWELENGMARSWNLMADGDCFVSLEDRDSLVCT